MQPRRLTPLLLAALLLAALLLGGCWDRIELEDRGIMLMMSIDRDGDGLLVTAQLAVPGQIALGPGPGGGGGGTQQPERAVDVVRATGPDLESALERMRVMTSKRIFFGHLRVVAVSEELARQGLDDVYDVLRRNAEIRRLTRLVVVPGEAAEVLTLAPRIERVPVRFFIELVNTAVGLGKVPDISLGTIWIRASAPGEEAVTPVIEPGPGASARITGLAVFRTNQLVDTLNLDETGVLMMILGAGHAGGAGRGGATLFVPFGGGGERVAVRVFSSRAQMMPRWEDDRVVVDLVIRAEADIVARTGARAVDSPEVLDRIARRSEAQIRQRVVDLVDRTQRVGADIFGFGEQVRAKLPDAWRRAGGTKGDWQRFYPQLEVNPIVHLELRRIGLENR